MAAPVAAGEVSAPWTKIVRTRLSLALESPGWPPLASSGDMVGGSSCSKPAEQRIVPAGYDQVVEALVNELPEDIVVRRCTICQLIRWRPGEVEIITTKRRFAGSKVIVTIPLGVLEAEVPQRGAIRFAPRLGAHASVVKRMGMGHVLRMGFRFEERSWRRLLPDPLRAAGSSGFGFIHAPSERIPVWWSLGDDASLTGWVGGTRMLEVGRRPGRIRATAIDSLSHWLGQPATVIRSALRDLAVHDWNPDPFSRGAYSYARAGQDAAAQRLREPVRDTIYFAGEAMADGEEIGTVHGAIASGLRAAQQVIAASG